MTTTRANKEEKSAAYNWNSCIAHHVEAHKALKPQAFKERVIEDVLNCIDHAFYSKPELEDLQKTLRRKCEIAVEKRLNSNNKKHK